MATTENIFEDLFATILERQAKLSLNEELVPSSYTQKLLRGGSPAITAKLREEAEEAIAAGDEWLALKATTHLHQEAKPTSGMLSAKRQHVIHEFADLLYHTFVWAGHLGIDLTDIKKELYRRSQPSDH